MGKLFPELQPRESLCERLQQPVLRAHAAAQRGHPKAVQAVVLPAVEKVKVEKVRRPPVPRMSVRRELQLQVGETWALSTKSSSSWRRRRPMSPFSLGEAAYTKEIPSGQLLLEGPWKAWPKETLGFGVYRQCIDEEMAEHDAEVAAFAFHRMDCQRQAGMREREQAALWRKRRDAREPLYQVRWLFLPHVAKKPPTPLLDEEKNYVCIKLGRMLEEDVPEMLMHEGEAPSGPPSRPPTPAGYWTNHAESHSQDLFGPDERTPLNHRVLERLKSRSHNMGAERNWRLTLMRKRQQREKAKKIMNSRPMTFMQDSEVNVHEFLSNIKPKDCADRTRQAYQAMLRQMCSNRKVDQADLQMVLSDLGFRPRTEREALRKLLSQVDTLEVDFDQVVQQLIPSLRTQLADLRGPGLLDLFTEADEDQSGALSVEELLAVLQRSGFYPQMKEVVETLVEVIPGARNHQNMEGKSLGCWLIWE
eukprot:g32407.t1